MRARAWLAGAPLALLLPLLYFPEWIGLAGLSPWTRLALTFVAGGVAGAAAARLDRATGPLRAGALAAAPVAALGALMGVAMAMEPQHLLLIVFAIVSFLACASIGAALAAGARS